MGISSIRVYIIYQNVLSGQFRAPVTRATLRARARSGSVAVLPPLALPTLPPHPTIPPAE